MFVCRAGRLAVIIAITQAGTVGAGTLAVEAAEKRDTAPKARELAQLVVVLGGDLGLGGSRQPVSPRGGYRHGRLTPWNDLTRGLAPLIDGDINFANLETVVTDSNRLRPANKAFNFKMHPNGLRHLVKIGFNALSTANNHAIDYGQAGMRHTLRHVARLRAAGLKAAPGLGYGRAAAARSGMINAKGFNVAIAALGIGGVGARSDKSIGQMSYRSKADFTDTVKALKHTEADLRVLSVHYGQELQVRPSAFAVAKLRDEAARDGNVDIVIGHHAHVAAGVQHVDGSLIFYGMGNLLHLGMQDMAKFGPCRDFGLLAKVHIARAGDADRPRPQAIEVIALTKMHDAAAPLRPPAAAKRIAVLNSLARGLDDREAGAQGVRFVPRPDGSGLFCMPGAETLSGQVGEMCKDWRELKLAHATRRQRKITCGYRRKQLVRRTKLRRGRSKAYRRKSRPSSSFARNFFRSAHGG